MPEGYAWREERYSTPSIEAIPLRRPELADVANFSSPAPGGESSGGNHDPSAAVSFVSPEPIEIGDLYQWIIDNR